jgi:hypothetical protein
MSITHLPVQLLQITHLPAELLQITHLPVELLQITHLPAELLQLIASDSVAARLVLRGVCRGFYHRLSRANWKLERLTGLTLNVASHFDWIGMEGAKLAVRTNSIDSLELILSGAAFSRGNINQLASLAVTVDSVSVLAFFRQHYTIVSKKLMTEVVGSGAINILTYLHSSGYQLHHQFYSAASRGCHLSILQYLWDNRISPPHFLPVNNPADQLLIERWFATRGRRVEVRTTLLMEIIA